MHAVHGRVSPLRRGVFGCAGNVCWQLMRNTAIRPGSERHTLQTGPHSPESPQA